MPATLPAPRRTAILAALVATALLIIGVSVSRFLGSGGSSADATEPPAVSEPARPPTPTDDAGPTAERAGLDVGFAPDQDGAVAAAVSFATAAQRWLYFTDDEIRAAVDEIATPVAATRMADEVVLDVSTARDQLAVSTGRVWWLVRPLAWRVEHDDDDDEARVSVWVVTILSAAEVAAPQAEYVTVTLDLAWIDGDWQVDGVRDTPGPTPMTGPRDQPWDAVPFDQSLDGFTRMDGEPVR